MTTSTVAPEIHAFAQGVRAALADLPAEDVDDLTEGLEADLAESLAEDLRRTLPDPVAYAAELRLAAGLPGRAADTKAGVFSGLLDSWRETREAVVVAVRRHPALAGSLDFLTTLRPAWWVLRAFIAAWCVAVVAENGSEPGLHLIGWLVFGVLAVLSVQWGRGRWTFPGLRGVVVAGNAVAVIAVVALASGGWWGSRPDNHVYILEDSSEDMTGVYSGGMPVTNIFGFDADGKPLDNIQLFDQDGRPLATAVAGGNGCLDLDCQQNGLWVPSTLRNGAVAWNVFPMRMVEAQDLGDGQGLTVVPGAEPQQRALPFKQVPPLVAAEKVAKSD